MNFGTLIPTYNNGKTLGNIIERTLTVCSDIVVVNDGSTDNTAEILGTFSENKNITVVSYPNNKGKGYALRLGLQKARELGRKISRRKMKQRTNLRMKQQMKQRMKLWKILRVMPLFKGLYLRSTNMRLRKNTVASDRIPPLFASQSSKPEDSYPPLRDRTRIACVLGLAQCETDTYAG